MNEFNPITELINFFEKNGWPLSINNNKLLERASYTNYPNKSGCFVVEIERHHPILETGYTPGFPMSAFQTYWLRYAVHPETKKVKKLTESKGEIYIGICGIVEEELEDGMALVIEPIGSNKYRILDYVVNETKVISTLHEAKSFALNLSKNYADFFKEFRLLESEELGISKEQEEKLLSEYKEELKEQIVKIVENLWEKAKKSDD